MVTTKSREKHRQWCMSATPKEIRRANRRCMIAVNVIMLVIVVTLAAQVVRWWLS